MITRRAAPRSARPVGVHVPVAAGLASAGLGYAAGVGAEVMQVFVGNPRTWTPGEGDEREIRALRAHVEATGLPVFVHSPYLVNVGSPADAVRARSAALLAQSLLRAREIGARGVVVHTGSSVTADRDAGLRRAREALLPVLDAMPGGGPPVLLEPMAGQGHMLCAAAGEIGPYLAALDWHPQAQLCLDTCHLFAAGHDLTAAGGVDAVFSELGQAGIARLRLIHANDARDRCGSRRDRHENVGKGEIGLRPFWELLHHPATAGVAFVAETPGGREGHRRDIATLKRLRSRPAP